MRKILFRGKRVDNGEWVYGYLQKYQETHASRLCICAVSVRTWRDALLYEIIPGTVGQFTGLLDKNGKEIYEGDVVRYDMGGECEVSYCIGGGFAGFDLSPAFHDEHQLTDVEVIGNIHDNPELMNNH